MNKFEKCLLYGVIAVIGIVALGVAAFLYLAFGVEYS